MKLTRFSQGNQQFGRRGLKGAQSEHAHRFYENQSADICNIQ